MLSVCTTRMGDKQTKQVPISGVACSQTISLSDSVFDNSNPDRLVEYVRTKRNIQRPRGLFSNIFNNEKPRKSFKLQLESYNNAEKKTTTTTNNKTNEKEPSNSQTEVIQISSNEKTSHNNNDDCSPKKTRLPRVLIKNGQFEQHANVRKSLLDEFEMTINKNDFQPPVFSTPVNCDDETSQKIMTSQKVINNKTNNTTIKKSRRKSLILQAIKPLTPKELEAAQLIECLEREQMENNVSLMQNNNSLRNVTLRNKDKKMTKKVCENLEDVEADQSTLKNQNELICNTFLIQKSQSTSSKQHKNNSSKMIENLHNPELSINKSQHLIQNNDNIIEKTIIQETQDSYSKTKSKSHQNPEILDRSEILGDPQLNESVHITRNDKIPKKVPSSQKQHLNDKNKSNKSIIYDVPETEELEMANISDSLTIPETQEPGNDENNINVSSRKKNELQQLENCEKENQVLLPKTPNRLTFTIHKINNTVTTPPRSEIQENEKSPIRISTSSQMSPLARRAQSQLRVILSNKKSQNKLPSKIPQIIRTEEYFQTISNQKDRVDLHLRNNQLSKHIDEDIINLNESNQQMVVIPIYQTINNSYPIPQTTVSSPIPPPSEFCDIVQTTDSLPIPPVISPIRHKKSSVSNSSIQQEKSVLKSPIQHDKSVFKSPIQQEKSSNELQSPTNKSNKHKTNVNITIDKNNMSANQLPPPLLDNELLTEDENTSSLRSIEIGNDTNYIQTRNLTLQNKSPINLIKNKTILKNKQVNETIGAIDLRTTRRSIKRKSSIIANNRINCLYEECRLKRFRNPISYNREIEKIHKKFEDISDDLINNDVNLTSENNIIPELLTPRFTPPPPIELNEDDDDNFQLAKDYQTENQQQNNLSRKNSTNIQSVRINGRTSMHMKKQNKILKDLQKNSPKIQQIYENLTEQHNINFHNDQLNNEEEILSTSSIRNKTNENNSISKSNRSQRNKLHLPKKKISNKFPPSNENINNDENNFQLSPNLIDNSVNKEINNEIINENNIQSICVSEPSEKLANIQNSMNTQEKNIKDKIRYDVQSSSTTTKSNKRGRKKSPILSKHLTYSMLKKNNFNRSIELDDSDDSEEIHVSVTHRSRSRKRTINNRKASQSSSPSSNRKSSQSVSPSRSERSTLINIEDLIIPNENEELVVDNPSVMTNYWKYSIANKSKVVEKKLQNDSLKELYLNVDKTINSNISTSSGRRKLYSKGESDCDNSPIPITKSTRNNTNNTQNYLTLKEKQTTNDLKINNNKQIIENIQDDWNSVEEFQIIDDDENPNITTNQMQNENSISNNSNKKMKKKNNKKSKEDDIATNTDNVNIFKIPTLPAPKSSRKNNQSNKQNNIKTSAIENKKKNIKEKESVEPKPREESNISDIQSSDQIDSTSQFGTPRRTSTKLSNNIEKKLKKDKVNNELKKLRTIRSIIIPNIPDNFNETSGNARRSNRKPCPRIQYWTIERNKLSKDTIMVPIIETKKRTNNKRKNKTNIKSNQRKNSELVEENNNFEAINCGTITEENENIVESESCDEEHLTQLVDILKKSFTQNKSSNRNEIEKKLSEVNKSNIKKKRKSKKNMKIDEEIVEKIQKDQPIIINQLTITEPLPSTSNAITTRNIEEPSTSNVVHYDSGNGTDVNNATKEVGPFSWLKNLINSNTSSSSSNNSNMIIDRLIMGKNLELASFNYMSTVEKDGIEYFFCNSTTQNFGFIKIKQKLMKKPSKLKDYNINFILFYGELEFTVADGSLKNVKAGEVVIIKKNVSYSIANKTDIDALLLFIKLK